MNLKKAMLMLMQLPLHFLALVVTIRDQFANPSVINCGVGLLQDAGNSLTQMPRHHFEGHKAVGNGLGQHPFRRDGGEGRDFQTFFSPQAHLME